MGERELIEKWQERTLWVKKMFLCLGHSGGFIPVNVSKHIEQYTKRGRFYCL